jgi:hypothetical protein
MKWDCRHLEAEATRSSTLATASISGSTPPESEAKMPRRLVVPLVP